MATHEEEWIEKYRAAVCAETAKRSRGAEVRAAFQYACGIFISLLRKRTAISKVAAAPLENLKVTAQTVSTSTLIPLQPISRGERISKVS